MRRAGRSYTTAEHEEALAFAQQALIREGHTPTVLLPPNQIKTMPELFQVRGEELDFDHVRSLVRAVGVSGKLDPVLVIKLKHKGVKGVRSRINSFVVVDGHHSLEAYKQTGAQEIECAWFPGTVPEAVDQSWARNGKDKLPLQLAARTEGAWKTVLPDNKISIKGTARKHGIGTSQVSTMRRVKFQLLDHGADGAGGLEVSGGRGRAEALARLKQLSWKTVWAHHIGLTKEDATKEHAAARLARSMKKWMKQQDPVVIAKALAIYDPTLRKPLIKALQEVEDAPEALKAAWQAYRDPEAVTTPDDHRAGDEAPDATQL